MRRMLLIALAIVLFTGCGSGTSDTGPATVVPITATREAILLHSPSGKVQTESEFRLQVRMALAEGIGNETFCRSLQGLSDDDAFKVIEATERTPNAEQARASAIFREECARFLGTSP